MAPCRVVFERWVFHVMMRRSIWRSWSFKEHRAACFSRVVFFGTRQRATSYMSEQKRARDSNTGSNPHGNTGGNPGLQGDDRRAEILPDADSDTFQNAVRGPSGR